MSTLRYQLFDAIRAGKVRTVEAAVERFSDTDWRVVKATLCSLRNNEQIKIVDGKLKVVPGATCCNDGRAITGRKRFGKELAPSSRPHLSHRWELTELDRCWPEPAV